MEDGRHHLPHFVPDARYAVPHHNNPHKQHHHHHLFLRPDFDLPNVGGGGAPAGLEASSPRVYIPPHLPQDPRMGMPQQQYHHPPPPPPLLDFRTNGDLALDRLLLRREAHPDFRDFNPLGSPKVGGILREDPRSWEQPAPAPLADPFFERQGVGRERLPVESRLGPPRVRMEDGTPRGKRSRVVDEFIDGDGVRYFRVSSSDSHGVPVKSPGIHGYQKGYRDDIGRHPSNRSAGKGKKLVSGGNSYNHKISVPNAKKKMKTGTGNGKRINFDQESRKGSVAASPSQAREDDRSGAETSAAGNTVDLDVSFKSNALVAKEIVVAPQAQTADSSKTVAPKKKKIIIKKKVRKLKPVAARPISGAPVANAQKKNAGPVPSSDRPAAVMNPSKDEGNSSRCTTSVSEQSGIVKGPELDSGNDRSAASGSDENVKLLAGDSGKAGGCTSDGHELCPESGEIAKNADSNSLGCSDDNPLNSGLTQCDGIIGQSSEKEFDGTVELQPSSKDAKASTLEGNPPSELVSSDACNTLTRTDPGELVQMSEGSMRSLHNSCENHLVSVTSENNISETPYVASCIHTLNSETFSSGSADKSEPDYAPRPEKKLRTNNGSALVAGTAPSDGFPKVPHVGTEGTGTRRNVRTEHKNPHVNMPSASQAASETPSKPTATALPSVAKVASQPIAKPKTVKASTNKELQGTNVPASLSQPAFFPSPPLSKSSKTTTAARMVGSRTWRRTDNTSNSTSTGQQVLSHGTSLGKQSLIKQDIRTKSSYVRKGNTLVRKSTPVDRSPVPPPSLGLASNKSPVTEKSLLANGPADGGDKAVTSTSVGFQNKMKAVNSLANENAGKIAPIERPDTPPLTQATKLPVTSPQSSPFLESLDLPPETGLGISSSPVVLDLIKQSSDDESNYAKISHIQNHFSATNSEGQVNVNSKEATLESKQMTYVKTKRNQLIAAAKPACHSSSSKMKENSQAPTGTVSHDFYYKKKKNQIVRDITASEGQSMQALVIPDDASNSEEKGSLTLLSQKRHSFSKRKTNRVSDVQTDIPLMTLKTWTRNGINSRPREYISFDKKWVLPSLVPWKRMTYTAYYGRSVLSGAIKNSLSTIRKLQLSRKRDTLYTRSGNGFSLRKSAVLSVGGRSLKWSKSIEKQSKQACEEATLAFAAVEKEKRKKSSGAVTKAVKHASRRSVCGIKLQPGERIFRISSVRYKMDSSKRTLLRIPDEKVTSSVSQLSEDSKKPSFVPKRLLIGNNEYVRIGSGNKLVRDPKRLTRMLANEKVKWSLHTVRSRLARKRQYCQFFTRFGKCNKSDGKCPYIHDPDKVAICTKFLKGSCLNENCKLTHKVIPERMPDCSFFLQGLCSNESCRYRHVNVNPAASICEGFLKGYCADGDECDKKHSYTCPQYESTGICTQRSTCRLHHPKKKDKPGKQSHRKRQKTTEGRYFVSRLLDVGKSGTAISDNKQSVERISEDAFISCGKFADYISLDIKDDDDDRNEAAQPGELSCGVLEAPIQDLVLDLPKPDLDMVIKPIRLMQKSAT
ncbi:uncharacterized protein LOC116253282 isoform X2 [Nymphaea colorata]|uniref:uncharacterized protein LOC116253282 isoform X2 n=1 Tax=Nymphaea colorata TaxID=210225 RepID=UPI00129DFB0B|nr:uncharacterized protein LOC116253282 isoform X2 [Nymphaea colorata]